MLVESCQSNQFGCQLLFHFSLHPQLLPYLKHFNPRNRWYRLRHSCRRSFTSWVNKFKHCSKDLTVSWIRQLRDLLEGPARWLCLLNLGKNGFGPGGSGMLCRKLIQHASALMHLDLARNQLHAQGADMLASAIGKCTSSGRHQGWRASGGEADRPAEALREAGKPHPPGESNRGRRGRPGRILWCSGLEHLSHAPRYASLVALFHNSI